MPKVKEINHPCHLLSLPSAKRFWCRHCMTVFEDAITRWRHSRSCRYGVSNNFMRRRELEAKALQNTAVLNPVEAKLEQSIQICDLASACIPGEQDSNNGAHILSRSESFNCLICHQKFVSLEEMRVHVKYPCSNSKIITSCAPHPRHSVPVFIDAFPGQTCQWQLPSQHLQNAVHPTTFVQTQTPQHSAQNSYDIDIQSQEEVESHFDSYDTAVAYDRSEHGTRDGITPTNIYVNEKGETVIEVENLDLNSEGGELSLAHLLAQLSQQGIVFDRSGSPHLQAQHEVTVSGDTSTVVYTTDTANEHRAAAAKVGEEEGQPTAEDAANTLAQLAGFRGFSRTNQIQSDGETQLHSQAYTVQTNSYNGLSSGPSRQCRLSTPPQMDIEYEYPDSLSACDPSIVSAQEMILRQAIKSASPEYENVKVNHAGAEETVQYYSDSSNVAYVSVPNSHHQIEVDADTVSSVEDLKHNSVDNDGAESVSIQSYPAHENGPGQLILAPTVTSAHQIHETQIEYVLSEEENAGDVEILLSAAPEDNTFTTNLNTNVSSHNPENIESTVLARGNPMQGQIQEGDDEFATQTDSLQEVVDSENKNIAFVEQILKPKLSSSLSASTLDMLAVTKSCEKQVAEDDASLLARSAHQTGRMTTHSAAVIVTSAGILPASNKNL